MVRSHVPLCRSVRGTKEGLAVLAIAAIKTSVPVVDRNRTIAAGFGARLEKPFAPETQSSQFSEIDILTLEAGMPKAKSAPVKHQQPFARLDS
jgi:hypothetical protein